VRPAWTTARGAERERLVQHLIVPQRLVVRMEEEVRMALDHPRHERRSGQLDDACARRRFDRRPRGRNLVALDQHGPVLVSPRIDAVEHARRLQDQSVGKSGRGRAQHRGEQQLPDHRRFSTQSSPRPR
jgi:hypothetical protein